MNLVGAVHAVVLAIAFDSAVLAQCVYTPPPKRSGGGSNRGPGDVVAPRTPPPPAPAAPEPAAPAAPRPTTPDLRPPATSSTCPTTGGLPTPAVATPACPTTPRGAPLEFDPTVWSTWWDLHKADFLQTRRLLRRPPIVSGSDDFYLGGARRESATDYRGPTRAILDTEVVPALHAALQRATSRDVITAGMLALAKIGIDRAEQPLLPAFVAQLASPDQGVRATAALALGLSHRPQALTPLIELWLDTARGRALVNRSHVDRWTRAFAGYGIGLLAHATSDASVARRALWALETPLRADVIGDRDVIVAAISGLRLARGNGDDPGAKALRAEIVDVLARFYRRQFTPGESILQAHAAPAIAAVLDHGNDGAADYLDAFQRDLDDAGPASVFTRQSAAIALGELRRPAATDAGDGDGLWRYIRTGTDQQARYFALIAAASIGGEQNRSALLLRLRTATTIERPWVALALGLFARARLAAGEPPDATIGNALHERLRQEKNENVLAAVAIALGLCRWQDAGADVRTLLAKSRQRDELAGHLCVALGLLGDRSSIELLREIVVTSTRRADLLTQAASALGVLGDRAVVADLTQMLQQPSRNVTTLAAIGQALGEIGDRRSIPPLLQLLRDASLPELSRAFVAAALGGIGDKDDVPWNAHIARVLNYRATVETLTNQVSGVLDIM